MYILHLKWECAFCIIFPTPESVEMIVISISLNISVREQQIEASKQFSDTVPVSLVTSFYYLFPH